MIDFKTDAAVLRSDYIFLKTTATRICHRKPVEHPGVADPITTRQGRPHVTYVEACLEYLCVAEVVYFLLTK